MQKHYENCVSNDVDCIDEYQICNMSSNVINSVANAIVIDASIPGADAGHIMTSYDSDLVGYSNQAIAHCDISVNTNSILTPTRKTEHETVYKMYVLDMLT